MSTDVTRFRAILARRMGLAFDDTRSGMLADALARRCAATGATVAAFLDHLDASTDRADIAAIAADVTVCETYFLRNIEQFRALAEVALPERLQDRAESRRLSMLSAGCASGEEAYSIAMVAREQLEAGWSVSITGIDANPAALAKAASGRYSTWSLRETPPEQRSRWFTSRGNEHEIDPEIRAAVRFTRLNLADDDAEIWAPGTWDVIFLRNVVMYFTPAAAQAVIARVTRSLMPGGYLFLGHAETLRGLSTDFHLCHTHGTFYYQRRGGPPVSSQPPTAAPVLPVSDPGWASGWIDTVQRATDRISALSQAVPPSPVAPPATRVDPLGPSRALFEAERFGDALLALDALPSAAAQDPDALLLRAAVLTHHGRLAAAAEACERLLAVDETSAGAHYLLALCREGGGDRSGARDHHQVAAHLDPTFAMPHLRLGLLARREGDLATARRELSEAIALFRREDGSRILLFGGGFGRQALTALCQAELLAAGGRP